MTNYTNYNANINTNQRRNYSYNALEKYARGWKIFIDTCCLLGHDNDDRAMLFWDNITPLLKKYNNKVIIPSKVVDELNKFANNPKRAGMDVRAQRVLQKLCELNVAGCIEIRGEKTDIFTDHVFQCVITKFRPLYNILLITEDRGLITTLESLNEDKSVRAHEVHLMRINRYGFLSQATGIEGSKSVPQTKQPCNSVGHINTSGNGWFNKPSSAPGTTFVPQNEKFMLAKGVTSIKDDVIPVSHIPQTGDVVRTQDGHTLRLRDSFASGGEGVLYETDTPYVAKIYKEEKITQRKLRKLNLMVSKHLQCEGICFPVSILLNGRGEFVGYLMPKAKGKELQRSVFLRPLLEKNFPNWKKRDTVELSVTILEKIKYLHDRNIIMGDINPANILVVSPKEVYFVDTDSYQVETFPCPVGTVNFTAPEIQRKHFTSFLRTMGNENFAVATLLFMLMLPGKAPYSQQGGSDPVSNIMSMEFPYALGDFSNKNAPEGQWRFIWSHLTYRVKEAFWNTFSKGGSHSTESTRLNVDEWLHMFREYLYLLDSGKFGEKDSMSEELFPTRCKKSNGKGPQGSVSQTVVSAPWVPSPALKRRGIFSFFGNR